MPEPSQAASSGAASSSEYVVVGAGLAGAATAWRLAQAGHEVTVLERTHPANEEGSSHGSARIFRYAYPDEFYVRLVLAARKGWDELEAELGEKLVSSVGAVDVGEARDPEQLARVLEKVGIQHEVLDPQAAEARWAGFTFDGPVLWHPGAGVLDAERSVLGMLELARRNGATILNDWDVASVTEAGGTGAGRYRLTAADGRTIIAANVIIAAGGWLPALLSKLPLPERFRSSLPTFEVRQEMAYHFPYRDDSKWTTFIHKTADIQVYSLVGGRDAGFAGQKIAEFNGGPVIPSALDQDGRISPENRARVVDFVRRRLPGLEPEPYAETTCLFTNTPDEEFIVDRVDGITVVSPCSGHGGKFAPYIGELAAALATAASPDATTFVPRRFRPSELAAV